jgi:peptidoglycan/LPS O-acetylase OafA/YrhL
LVCFHYSLVLVANYRLDDPAFYGWFAALAAVIFPFHSETFLPRPINWVLWSIGVEVWFSVFFPVLVAMIKKFGWRRVLVIVFTAAFSTRLVGHVFLYMAPQGQVLNVISDSVLGRLDEFVMGMPPFVARYKNDRCLLPVLFGLIGIAIAMCFGAHLSMELYWARHD